MTAPRFDYTTLPAESIKAAYLARLAQEGCSPLTVLVEIGDAARAMPAATGTRDALLNLAKEIKANAEDHPRDYISKFALKWADQLAALVISTPRPESDARDGWRPIATAPKGELILYFPDEYGRNRQRWMVRVDTYPVIYPRQPTHWMPIPAAPAALTQPEAK